MWRNVDKELKSELHGDVRVKVRGSPKLASVLMNVSIKYNRNSSNHCRNISVWNKVSDQPTDRLTLLILKPCH